VLFITALLVGLNDIFSLLKVCPQSKSCKDGRRCWR